MKTIYIYVLDTLADWELGTLTAELNSKRFFKKDADDVVVKTVSYSKAPIHTMGGIPIVPELLVQEVVVNQKNILLLPGAETWNLPTHDSILEKVQEFLTLGGTVGAICGATIALANKGILEHRCHTSNGSGFLEMVSPEYRGQSFYVDQPAVSSTNLITAGATNSLAWTREIINKLEVFSPNTLSAWYHYFQTGNANDFFELMETLSK